MNDVASINQAGFANVVSTIDRMIIALETQTQILSELNIPSQPTTYVPDFSTNPELKNTALETANQSVAMENLETTLNLNLNLNSTTQLTVDGAVLAQVVKTFLYEDIQRLAATSTTVSNSVI
jgi:hypothetical protein